MRKKGIMLFLMVSVILGVPFAQAVDITMHGKLVAEPCAIVPGDEKQEVFVGNIGVAWLYDNPRTPGTDFNIRLKDCDTTIVNYVSIIFTGFSDCEMTDYLSIRTGCAWHPGAVIGLETQAGKFLPLDKKSDLFHLVNGANIIGLRAFVRATDRAIEERSIVAQQINATAWFTLDYT